MEVTEEEHGPPASSLWDHLGGSLHHKPQHHSASPPSTTVLGVEGPLLRLNLTRSELVQEEGPLGGGY